MAKTIQFYYDFASPYGYMASTQIFALAAKYGRTVEWKPMLLGVAFKVTGGMPLPSVPLKGDYSRRDMERTARLMDIPVMKEKLKLETEAAIQRGVFGSPFIFVDGEPFWGCDRLQQVERWLQTGGW